MSNLSIFQRQGIYQIIAVCTHRHFEEKTAKSSVEFGYLGPRNCNNNETRPVNWPRERLTDS